MHRAAKDLTDSEITKMVISGRKEEYAMIVRRYQAKLLRYTTYLLGNPDDAQDSVQDTLIRAYINLQSYDQARPFSSWIYRIAHNQAINRLRARPHSTAITDNQLDQLKSPDNVEDDYVRAELKRRTHRCLKALPTRYRAPLTLYYLEDKSYQEISDILRLPIGTISAQLNRAKKYLRSICQKNQ